MVKKFYAVRKGVEPGIYETWNESQTQINGYSGAEYKSFSVYSEAEQYLQGEKNITKNQNNESSKTAATAYVDGSYESVTNRFSCGVVIFYDGKEEHFSELFCDDSLSEMNNVAGEIKGSERAIQYCLDNKINSIAIYHDYEGISKWCTGEWRAKKEGTKAYKAFYEEAAKIVDIHFVKVKGHSGDKYNELADYLAKEAFEHSTSIIQNEMGNTEDKHKVAKIKSVFINREEIKNLILKAGYKQWETFEASELVKTGNPYRCNVVADGKKAIVDFYYNVDGSTTIAPVGANIEISTAIKIMIEEGCTYANNAEGRTYSFKKLPTEWSKKLIEYLTTLVEGVIVYDKVDKQPIHDVYRFSSNIGDNLIVNLYENGTITLQGKPAYLYSEAISFLSYCENVSVDDIIDTVNSFHNVNIKTEDVRNEMEVLLPRSYKNIDEMILKLLSPSISLRKIKMPLEDYSCYAFPALRALEGYIKYLFSMKTVHIGHTFYKIFDNGVLTSEIATQISDINFQQELERLYDYLIHNRHVIFHTEQILIGTTILDYKQEADEIVNNVLNLIETSYININKQ